MKKILLAYFVLIPCITMAQSKMEWFNPMNLTNISYSTDVGSYKNVAYKPYTLVGMSISVLGIYYDFGNTGSLMGDSADIGVWEDSSAKYWHIGYTIPISKWFTITPLYGKITNNKLIVDGNDWWVNSGGICNRTDIIDTIKYNDYGAVVKFNILGFLDKTFNVCTLTLGTKITKFQTTFNIGFDLYIGKCIKYLK